nr:hypothetical protein [Deltaproteobacteria bacterium]
MGTRDGLEAALLASWDRETLAVYADHLQAQGDPRGELIALDLELATRSSPELVARRTSLMTGWLGRLVPSNPHTPWIGDSFRFGFVDNLVLEGEEDATGRLEQVLASPLAPYLKRVTLRGDTAHISAMLRGLSCTTHAWLSQLAVRAWGQPVVEQAIVDGLIAVTPALSTLDVHGHDVFSTFAHPSLRRLRITGHGALPGMFDEHAPMVGVEALDLALDEPADQERWTDPPLQPIARLCLPALRKLDLSRNEPEQRRTGDFFQDPDGDYEPEDATGLQHRSALQ